MEIITGTLEFELKQDTAVAIGKFDGLHLGHQKLLENILKKKQEGLAVCVLTFDPSPAVLFGLTDGKELTTKEEKRCLLEKMGVDILVEFPMNKENAAMEPEQFIEKVLVEKMHVKYLAAGTDVSFGARGAGNATLLKRLAGRYDYKVETIEKVMVDGMEISSTLVRGQVEQGNMEQVSKLLGVSYMLKGQVQHGKALGRKLGMPTANLIPGESKLLPPCGVYYSTVTYKGKEYPAISNIGYKPTVSNEKVLGVETFLYDFDEMLYEEDIEVAFLHYKRSEMRFSNVDELKEQMQKDIFEGKRYHFVKMC